MEAATWTNRSWGFHEFDRHSESFRVAIASDDSRHIRWRARTYRHYLFLDAAREHTLGYNAQLRRMFYGNHTSPFRCVSLTPSLPVPGDPANHCDRTAAAQYEATEFAGNGSLHGMGPVVRYGHTEESGGRVTVSFAPGHNCEAVEYDRVHPGFLGIPAARSHVRVRSIIYGEPDRALFAVPQGPN